MNAYLDNSATTKPCPEAVLLAGQMLESGWYNPSALYRPAMETEKQMAHVREVCLNAAEAKGNRIVFTSGGTESDNLALLGHLRCLRGPGRVLISSVEHPAVSACADEIRRMGFTTEEIPAGPDGRIDTDKMNAMMGPDVVMISVMQVNNETGATEPLREIAEARNRYCPQAAIHVDGVQGFLRTPVGFNRLGIQSYALSAHKIHGLKGTGALIIAKNHRIAPIQYGGGQEEGLRSGTENTVGILTLGAAAESWRAGDADRIRRLKIRLWQEITRRIPESRVNGPAPDSENAAPHILNIALEPVRSQTMLFALEGDGVYVSAGSACASRKQKVSKVLTAMGIANHRADCSIRFSLGRLTTEEEICYAAECVERQYNALKRYTRR